MHSKKGNELLRSGCLVVKWCGRRDLNSRTIAWAMVSRVVGLEAHWTLLAMS